MLLAGGGAGGRLLVLVFSLSANLLLNLTLDGPFGAYGAAWATVRPNWWSPARCSTSSAPGP